MISVLVLTLNEEHNLPRCLDALRWSDDVLVLDSFSTDRTVEVAEAHGARVLERTFDSFAGQRNFGLEHGGLRHDWVLHVDADEVVTPTLRDELLKVAREGGKDAYRVASKTMFQGQWLKHSGLYPSYQVRFGRKDKLVFTQVGHGQREVLDPSALGTLNEPLEHYTFSKGLEDWLARHNRYSSDEAALAEERTGGVDVNAMLGGDPTARRRALKSAAGNLPLRPTLRFLYMYFIRKGFLDGKAGLTYCRLLAMYERMIVLKETERSLRKRGVQI